MTLTRWGMTASMLVFNITGVHYPDQELWSGSNRWVETNLRKGVTASQGLRLEFLRHGRFGVSSCSCFYGESWLSGSVTLKAEWTNVAQARLCSGALKHFHKWLFMRMDILHPPALLPTLMSLKHLGIIIWNNTLNDPLIFLPPAPLPKCLIQ